MILVSVASLRQIRVFSVRSAAPWGYILRLVNLTVFDEMPSSITCIANDTVNFNCSVRGEGDILWYVNNTFAIALPPKLNARFETTLRRNGNDQTLGEASVLKFIAKPEMNNSRIECAVGLNRKITNHRASAMLYVGKHVKL